MSRTPTDAVANHVWVNNDTSANPVIMFLVGDGGVAQVLPSAGQTTSSGGNGNGKYQSISWAWGIGVMLDINVVSSFPLQNVPIAACVEL